MFSDKYDTQEKFVNNFLSVKSDSELIAYRNMLINYMKDNENNKAIGEAYDNNYDRAWIELLWLSQYKVSKNQEIKAVNNTLGNYLDSIYDYMKAVSINDIEKSRDYIAFDELHDGTAKNTLFEYKYDYKSFADMLISVWYKGYYTCESNGRIRCYVEAYEQSHDDGKISCKFIASVTIPDIIKVCRYFHEESYRLKTDADVSIVRSFTLYRSILEDAIIKIREGKKAFDDIGNRCEADYKLRKSETKVATSILDYKCEDIDMSAVTYG